MADSIWVVFGQQNQYNPQGIKRQVFSVLPEEGDCGIIKEKTGGIYGTF